MEFCSNCGSSLQPKKAQSSNQVLLMLVCPKCGKKQNANSTEYRIGKIIKPDPRLLISIVSHQEQEINTLSTLQIKCPNCQNNQAYVWQVQTRGSDQSSTQFFRCTNCNHTFREYT